MPQPGAAPPPDRRPVKLPRTRRRAYRKNDHPHREQKNWSPGRQRCGHDRCGHPELAPLRNDREAKEWSQFTNPCKPTFKRWQREKKGGKPVRVAEKHGDQTEEIPPALGNLDRESTKTGRPPPPVTFCRESTHSPTLLSGARMHPAAGDARCDFRRRLQFSASSRICATLAEASCLRKSWLFAAGTFADTT